MQIMKLKQISKSYSEKMVLNKISLKIYSNEIIALVGENGSGKSTLLKIIAGLHDADSGEIHKSSDALKIGYVPEIPPASIPFTVFSYLIHMGRISGIGREQLHFRINELLDLFQMDDARNTKMKHLSKGMKQKVIIMQAMLERVELLIMDEPLSGLDYKAQMDLETTLLKLKEHGLSIILTCHETKLLEVLVDRILFLKNQQLIEGCLPSQKADYKNKLIFEIPASSSIDAFLSYLDVQKESFITDKIKVLEAILEQQHTDDVLSELLKAGASVKQLNPLHKAEEAFNSYF